MGRALVNKHLKKLKCPLKSIHPLLGWCPLGLMGRVRLAPGTAGLGFGCLAGSGFRTKYVTGGGPLSEKLLQDVGEAGIGVAR